MVEAEECWPKGRIQTKSSRKLEANSGGQEWWSVNSKILLKAAEEVLGKT